MFSIFSNFINFLYIRLKILLDAKVTENANKKKIM